MSCSVPVTPSVAVRGTAVAPNCAPSELASRLLATPGRHIHNPVPVVFVHAKRRDGTIGVDLRLPPFPLVDGVCPYRLPAETKACSAGEVAQAVTLANARNGVFMGYDVDIDCVLEAEAAPDNVGDYVQAVRDFARDEHRCETYDAHQSKLGQIEQSGQPRIVEIAFIRGYMAEICEGGRAAIPYYAGSLRAGYGPAQLRLSAITEARGYKP